MAELTIHQALEIGLQHHSAGNLRDAELIYRKVLEVCPTQPDALHLLGAVAHQMLHHDVAVDLVNRAIQFKPDKPEYYNTLGLALDELNRLDEAEVSFRQALVLRPDFPEAHRNLGKVIQAQGRIEEAIASFRQALAIKPSYASARSGVILALRYLTKTTWTEIQEEQSQWQKQHAAMIQPRVHQRSAVGSHRRLRIGYVSPDFCDHPVGRFLLPLFRCRNAAEFEIFCYSEVRHPDGCTEEIMKMADHWRSTLNVDDATVADWIAQDGIDILVDLAMHTAGNRLFVFARKLAPVQISYLAYPGGAGLDAIDYRISDHYLDPRSESEAVGSDRILRLSGTYWCYAPHSGVPGISQLPARRNGYITFGSLNNFNKVSDEAMRLWCRLLREVPASRLMLYAPEGISRRRIQEIASLANVELGKIQYLSRASCQEYLAHYARIDIALDPFPCHGATTTCDALWMGLPVVTLAGKMPHCRSGVSILSNLGITEWIAYSEDEYIRIAVGLAGDAVILAKTRESLRQRMADAPLMNAKEYAASAEAAYRVAWENWGNPNER